MQAEKSSEELLNSMETKVIHPQNVCSREITVNYENGVIDSVSFTGGCQGNTTGLCQLLKGRKINDVISLLEGIKCRGSRTGMTSCPDQLAQGLKNK